MYVLNLIINYVSHVFISLYKCLKNVAHTMVYCTNSMFMGVKTIFFTIKRLTYLVFESCPVSVFKEGKFTGGRRADGTLPRLCIPCLRLS